MKDVKIRTAFLLPKNNFWTGFSSIINIFGSQNKFKTSKSGEEADYKALKADWEMIGQDFKNALTQFEVSEIE